MQPVPVLLISCLAAVASAKFQNGAYLLDGKARIELSLVLNSQLTYEQCGSDDDCGRRCHDKNEYLKPGVLPPEQIPYADKFAQFLTGTCNWDGTDQCGCNASDDTACENIYTCVADYKGCRPKAKQSTDRANFLCDCPKVCNEADGHPDFPH
ncbi:hypothetical protein IWZ01DRAFT_536523 [Phyllosticta capitalensis]